MIPLHERVSLVGGAVTDCTTATQIATGHSGPGWLTIKNLDASATIYVGGSTVTGSTNGGPLAPGSEDTCLYEDVSKLYAIGSAIVGWWLRR